jgi:hypothetical protein
MPATDWLAIMYQAMRSPRGLVIQSNDVPALKQKLYRLMRANTDISLSLVTSPESENHLWLVKGKKDAQDG